MLSFDLSSAFSSLLLSRTVRPSWPVVFPATACFRNFSFHLHKETLLSYREFNYSQPCPYHRIKLARLTRKLPKHLCLSDVRKIALYSLSHLCTLKRPSLLPSLFDLQCTNKHSYSGISFTLWLRKTYSAIDSHIVFSRNCTHIKYLVLSYLLPNSMIPTRLHQMELNCRNRSNHETVLQEYFRLRSK